MKTVLTILTLLAAGSLAQAADTTAAGGGASSAVSAVSAAPAPQPVASAAARPAASAAVRPAALPSSGLTGPSGASAALQPMAQPMAIAGNEPTAAVAPPAAPAEACTVRAVSGTAEWRPAGAAEAAWTAIKVGDKLTLGADIRTGFRAKCTLAFADESSIVEVQPMTLLKIGEFEKQGDKVRTRLYVKQGSTRSAVEKGRFQSDFAIVTPEVTLAVRGTRGIELRQYADMGPRIGLTTAGLIHVSNHFTGRGQNLRPGDSVNRDLLPPGQNLQFNRTVRVFDLHGGLTEYEQVALLRQSQNFGGTLADNGPGGQNQGPGPGGLLQQQNGVRQFYQQHPNRLPGANLHPPGPSVFPSEEGREGT